MLTLIRCSHLRVPCSRQFARQTIYSRSLFNLFKKAPSQPEFQPTLSQDNLFHPFSGSPFPAIVARGEAIKSLAPCPVCASHHDHTYAHAKAQPLAVAFECPDCGWPTHCTEEHWQADPDHAKYCSRLREVNEDEHDLRSGRRLREFELPGPQDTEAAISFSNWDVFWYTRNFASMDTERSRRHASKLLTYPITIGSVIHQYSALTLGNQRLTPEGSRSLAALRLTLHGATGTPETEEASIDKPQMRIFILGARAESSLPPHVWEQLTLLFPAALFHLYFIGPQVSLPKKAPASHTANTSSETASQSTGTSSTPQAEGSASSESVMTEEEKPVYLPNVYEPPTPAPIVPHKRTRSSIERYGVPSYTVPYTPQLTITGMQCNYHEVHAQFQDTFDPYTDLFFMFSPGFGFPSPTSVSDVTGEPLLQIESPTEWGPVLPLLLATKCPIFVTGFSPTDVERDIKSMSIAPGVAGEFDWVITPGENAFGSEKWEVADFDPRVMVKTNWGVWGIRGKRRDVRERSVFGFD
ncbi:zinc-finger of mitochondrial splicing suppressor 51-domain-containing protein [Lactarius sanguifluus]|nr:zinc-finger of mitochondrial splicing suppressor 51-domain-containing protein [Lactarius sanguifluus]